MPLRRSAIPSTAPRRRPNGPVPGCAPGQRARSITAAARSGARSRHRQQPPAPAPASEHVGLPGHPNGADPHYPDHSGGSPSRNQVAPTLLVGTDSPGILYVYLRAAGLRVAVDGPAWLGRLRVERAEPEQLRALAAQLGIRLTEIRSPDSA